MYPWWSTLGIFMLGVGVGSLTTAASHAGQIHKLKELVRSAHNNSQTEENGHESDERKSA
jgi:hypothetical protein